MLQALAVLYVYVFALTNKMRNSERQYILMTNVITKENKVFLKVLKFLNKFQCLMDTTKVYRKVQCLPNLTGKFFLKLSII
jgi:hypothetical protein